MQGQRPATVVAMVAMVAMAHAVVRRSRDALMARAVGGNVLDGTRSHGPGGRVSMY